MGRSWDDGTRTLSMNVADTGVRKCARQTYRLETRVKSYDCTYKMHRLTL